MAIIRADLAELNKKAGITFIPQRHYDSKRDNIYCDWMYRHSWSTNKGYINLHAKYHAPKFPCRALCMFLRIKN